MNLLAFPKMIFSFHGTWDELHGQCPPVVRTFFQITLPFSLLSALMIAVAGHWHGAYYAPATPTDRWDIVAALFFIVQLLTVPLMASLIQAIARDKGAAPDYRESYLAAALAPIPLWLSTLSLGVPSIAFAAACGLAGLAASASLLYHGLPALLGIHEELDAQDISYKVFAIGALVWALLVIAVVAPVIRL